MQHGAKTTGSLLLLVSSARKACLKMGVVKACVSGAVAKSFVVRQDLVGVGHMVI